MAAQYPQVQALRQKYNDWPTITLVLALNAADFPRSRESLPGDLSEPDIQRQTAFSLRRSPQNHRRKTVYSRRRELDPGVVRSLPCGQESDSSRRPRRAPAAHGRCRFR